MREQVIVSQKVPNFLPKLDNPLYKLAMKQKEKLRKEIIERIKSGDLEEGLFPYALTLEKFTLTEVKAILDTWHKIGRDDLIINYATAILENDLENIGHADQYYLLNKNIEKVESR